MNKFIRWGLISAVTLTLGRCNAQLYSPVPERTQYADVERQFADLRAALDGGAGERMQQRLPEGYFLSHVLYGLAWVNVGLQENLDPSVAERALGEARWAYGQLSRPTAREPFPADQVPPHGIFYVGWRNYLLSGILLLQQPNPLVPQELELYQQQCEAIADALTASDSPFLPSYPGSTWPVDTFPALVSLQGHSQLVNSRYESVISAWLTEVKALPQADLPLLDHRISPFVQGPRGTSQALMLRFLPELDGAWAAESYGLFRQQFVTQRLGLPGIRESPRPGSSPSSSLGQNPNPRPEQPGRDDVDSGPLLAGVSLSATALSLGTARVNGDVSLQRAIWKASDLLGLPMRLGRPWDGPWNGGREQKRYEKRYEKRYGLGGLPVTDAFLLWSKTATPWFREPLEPVADYGYPRWWRWPSHGLSLLLWMLLLWGVSDRRKARQRRRVALQQRRTESLRRS